MARVHVLRGQDRVFGFTPDEQGTNLPRQYGPWTTFKTIELHHDEPYQGVDVGVCLNDIGKHGLHSGPLRHKRIQPPGARALVLGGGGASGNAWLSGVIAGLFDAGLDVTQADLDYRDVGRIDGGGLGIKPAILPDRPNCLPRSLPLCPRHGRVRLIRCRTCSYLGSTANHMERTGAIIAAAQDADMRRRSGCGGARNGCGSGRLCASAVARHGRRPVAQPGLAATTDAHRGCRCPYR